MSKSLEQKANLNSYRDIEKQKALDEINSLREQASRAKETFLKTDIATWKPEYHTLHLMGLLSYYQSLIFFPDEEILAKFEQLGIKKSYLNWFTHIDDINYCFDKIEEETFIYIFRKKAIDLIKLHLTTQATVDIFVFCKLYTENKNGVKIIKLTSDIKNALRRKKRSARPQKKTFYEAGIEGLANTFSEFEKELSMPKDYILKLTQGKTDQFFIKDLIKECFIYPSKMGRVKFLNAIYLLLHLILKDNLVFLTEDEIDKQVKYVGKTYQDYIARRITTFINKK